MMSIFRRSVAAGLFLFARCLGAEEPNALRLTAKGELVFPENYREWVWLSSGLGMSYNAEAAANPSPNFDNVFVSPQAYRTFAATGLWPKGSVFVLEIRESHNQGSINKAGHYQGDLTAVEAHVKGADGTWAFYGFGKETKPGHLLPKDAKCYSCHERHGAADTTFVQFYPTLLKIAREKKTLNEKISEEDVK